MCSIRDVNSGGSVQQYFSPEESKGKCTYHCSCKLDWNYTYLTLGRKKKNYTEEKKIILAPLLLQSPAPGISSFKNKVGSHFGEKPAVWNLLSKTKCGLLTSHNRKRQDLFTFYSILKASLLPAVSQTLKRQIKSCNWEQKSHASFTNVQCSL